MRVWNEIKGLMITDSGSDLLIRYHIFDKGDDKFKGADIILGPDDIYELYIRLKEKIMAGIAERSCLWCAHSAGGVCLHPDAPRAEYECRNENQKHFKPRYEIAKQG